LRKMVDIEEDSFKHYLEYLVDLLPAESAELMVERPRYAHAVLVLANPAISGELMKASYVKQLDPVILREMKKTQIIETEETIEKPSKYSKELQLEERYGDKENVQQSRFYDKEKQTLREKNVGFTSLGSNE
jgi:N-acetylmuramoyl-L-alanine amidase CwlA